MQNSMQWLARSVDARGGKAGTNPAPYFKLGVSGDLKKRVSMSIVQTVPAYAALTMDRGLDKEPKWSMGEGSMRM